MCRDVLVPPPHPPETILRVWNRSILIDSPLETDGPIYLSNHKDPTSSLPNVVSVLPAGCVRFRRPVVPPDV